MGRTTERRELEGLLHTAHGGLGRRLLLVGDPGVGTSALLRWLQAQAEKSDLRTALIAAIELRDAPDLPARLTANGPAADLLLIDDAHTLDSAAGAALAAAVAGTPLRDTIVVVAGWTGCPVARALADWPTLHLGPLDPDESARLLELTLDREHTPSVLYRLAESLGGNALALCQVPRLLSADQLSGRRPLPTSLPMPPAIDEAWGRRIDPLPEPARRAAIDLVVCGPRLDLLSAMQADAGWSDDDLAALADAGLVRLPAGGAPELVHALVAHVIAARTPTATVRARHRRAAEIGARIGIPPRAVVEHLVNGTATADDDVATALEEQARRAEALDQLIVASDAWQAAARMSTSGPQRVSRGLSGLRLVIENGLDYAGTDALLDLLADEQMEAECALWVEWLRTLQRSESDPSAALTAQWSTIRRARVAAPETLRALLWDAAMNAWSLGDAEAGLEAAQEYVEVAEAMPSAHGIEPDWTGTALVASGLFQVGRVCEATQLRRQAIEAAAAVEPTALPFDQLLSIVFLDDLLLDMSPAANDRALVAAQRAAERTAPVACLDGIRAWRARASGDWSTAHRLLARGRPLAALTGATGAQIGMAALACELAALEGDDETLQAEAGPLRAHIQQIGDRRRLATLDRALGMRALVDGLLDEAAVGLGAAADAPFLGRGLRDAILPSRVDLVEVLMRRGDVRTATVQAEAVTPLLEAMDDPLARALALRTRALAADDLDLLEAALAAHSCVTDPFEEARTRLLLAERLRRDHQRGTARPHLLVAERLFADLGATPWLLRTRSELRAAGGQPTPAADLSALTAQETAVARAVAAGRSNREVAEALFLSPRTVEYHLGSVYRKLGIRGRAALTRIMVDA